MKLAILQTDNVKPDLALRFGEYPDMFAKIFHEVNADFDISGYDIQRGEYPSHIDDADAYLITGSSSSVYERQEWIHGLGRFVKDLHGTKKKTIGICFGHQIIAHFLGGATEKASSGWHIGVRPHHLNEQWKADTGLEDLNLIFSHQDQIIRPAPGSEILASTDDCPIAICAIGKHLLTIQAHPEFEPEYALELINSRKSIYSEKLLREAMNSFDRTNHRQICTQMMVDFIRS